MKKRYEDMSKEEKKKILAEFYATDFGKTLKPLFKRILIVAILLLLYAIYLYIDAFINDFSLFGIFAASSILLFSLFFFIARIKVRKQKVNNYLQKRK